MKTTLTDLIDAYHRDNEQNAPRGFQGLRHVYVNEDIKRVYLSPKGSVFPNKYTYWDSERLDKGE